MVSNHCASLIPSISLHKARYLQGRICGLCVVYGLVWPIARLALWRGIDATAFETGVRTMQKTLTLVLTRINWLPGNVEANFLNIKMHTDKRTAIKEIAAKATADFIPLGIRDENNWIWQA